MAQKYAYWRIGPLGKVDKGISVIDKVVVSQVAAQLGCSLDAVSGVFANTPQGEIGFLYDSTSGKRFNKYAQYFESCYNLPTSSVRGTVLVCMRRGSLLYYMPLEMALEYDAWVNSAINVIKQRPQARK